MNPEGNQAGWTIELLAWLEVNKKRLAVAALAAGLVASVIAIYQWRAHERERSAQAALQKIQLQSNRDSGGGSVRPTDYLQLAAQYGGTRAAAAARLLAAEQYFREGNYAEARAEFGAAGELLRDAGLQAVAAYGQAACLDALGQTDDAFQAYQDVTVRHATAAVASQARLQMAELLEAKGDPAQALRLYDELAAQTDSLWSGQAQEMREFLLSRHPDLKTAATPADGAGTAVPSTNAAAAGS